ncbi:hypothetical protein Cylst_4420 [Cylindrospermum stagnale PCC 7417]|uniref:Uncharacterized protein n=1 Tax=Cylindrospermum stagnale PCC 7417 TaxID=56107 RepID=K9X360_9NOST|nr:hypothetical protein Cylst_4420 [Cylindrospermum stagnale PCC 7417]
MDIIVNKLAVMGFAGVIIVILTVTLGGSSVVVATNLTI